MRTENYYVIYRAGEGPRIVSRRPSNLRTDEIAYRMQFNIPGNWGRIQGETILLELPDVPEVGELEEV